MGQRVIDRITRFAPNFESLILKHTTFTPEAHGHDVRGSRRRLLPWPDPPRPCSVPYRPGPRGYVDQPHDIAGLYLGSAGCYGGPGITFIPGYNAAQAVLDDH